MQSKFGGKGLTIIGVTDEAQAVTDKWIARYDAQFAYGYDKKNELARWFSVRGIPHAVLVDPNGTIVWRGMPGQLDQATLDRGLKGALPIPISDWPKSASKVAKYARKRDYAKALAEAEKLDGDERAEIVAAIETLVDGKRDSVARWMEEKDYLAVEERGGVFAKELKGLPQGDAVEALLGELEADDAAQGVLEAQRRVAKLMSRKIQKNARSKVKRELEQIAKEHPETGASRDAKTALAKLR